MWIGAGVLAACAGAALISIHAAEQGSRSAVSAHAAGAAPPRPSLPPLPDADTIRDEPAVAPDPKESADNNVSLPADI